ncbi:MAG: FAD-binding protein [Deltaproteobacteria bacterium]|nr:FAD-binding protein [Deltaproteobacteria bacterium]
MAYTPELKQLIRKVEQTRPLRLAKRGEGWEFPRMSLAEKEDRVRLFHPSYKEGSLQELTVGPSKGYSVPPEIFEILESWSRIDPDRIDLSKIAYEMDVLIIGGGGAGTAAALLAQENGANTLIATKLRHGDANTMMAEGGIQAVSQPGKDSPYYHYLDTLGGGHFANIPQLVFTLVTQAPSVIQWLEGLGVMFDKKPDGNLKVFHLGGMSRKRDHVAADITGTEIMRTIRDEARNRDGIRVLEFSPVVELVLNEQGHCAGAILYNLETEEYFLVKAKAVILATGGSGRLHIGGFPTTNHYGATGDGLVLGYRAGVGVCLLHTTQFHPTGAIFPEQAEGLLISEKFRGVGVHLLNTDGEQFVCETEPRDACASSIIRECARMGKGVLTPVGKAGVWLDTPMIDLLHGEGSLIKQFVGKYKLFKRYGIDIAKEPILVYPTLHYQNGGLKFDEEGETTIPGLYAAGEVTGGVHGENRLGGNSLIDVLVFGRIAGKNAAIYAREKAQGGRLTLDHVRKFHQELKGAGVDRKKISPILLPDYSNPLVRDRQLTTNYEGTIR